MLAQFCKQRSAQGKSQGSGWDTLFFLTMQMHVFLNAFHCFSSLTLSAASTRVLWRHFFWKLREKMWIFFSQWQSRRFTTRLCTCCLWPLHVTQTAQVLATPWPKAAVQKPVWSWTKDRDIASTGRGIDVGLRRILERQAFYILLFCLKSDFKRDCKSLTFLHVG